MKTGLNRRTIVGGAASLLLGPAFAAGVARGVGAADKKPVALPADLPISFGGPFSLTDHNGTGRTDQDFLGRFMLIYFGYTHCPDLCPTGLRTLSDALEALGPLAARIQPLFVSVDPARDTVGLLRGYVGHFHPALIGLTGTEQQVKQVARAYRIHRLKVVTADSSGPDDYLVTHSTITYLMGPDGRFVALFPHDTEAGFMTETLRKYVTVRIEG